MSNKALFSLLGVGLVLIIVSLFLLVKTSSHKSVEDNNSIEKRFSKPVEEKNTTIKPEIIVNDSSKKNQNIPIVESKSIDSTNTVQSEEQECENNPQKVWVNNKCITLEENICNKDNTKVWKGGRCVDKNASSFSKSFSKSNDFEKTKNEKCEKNQVLKGRKCVNKKVKEQSMECDPDDDNCLEKVRFDQIHEIKSK